MSTVFKKLYDKPENNLTPIIDNGRPCRRRRLQHRRPDQVALVHVVLDHFVVALRIDLFRVFLGRRIFYLTPPSAEIEPILVLIILAPLTRAQRNRRQNEPSVHFVHIVDQTSFQVQNSQATLLPSKVEDAFSRIQNGKRIRRRLDFVPIVWEFTLTSTTY